MGSNQASTPCHGVPAAGAPQGPSSIAGDGHRHRAWRTIAATLGLVLAFGAGGFGHTLWRDAQRVEAAVDRVNELVAGVDPGSLDTKSLQEKSRELGALDLADIPLAERRAVEQLVADVRAEADNRLDGVYRRLELNPEAPWLQRGALVEAFYLHELAYPMHS